MDFPLLLSLRLTSLNSSSLSVPYAFPRLAPYVSRLAYGVTERRTKDE